MLEHTAQVAGDDMLAYATAFALGIILHVTVFQFGEWDLYTLSIINTAVVLAATLSVAIYSQQFEHITKWIAMKTGFSLVWALVAGVFSSMLVYRASFLHRLHRFPGPFAARLSNLWISRRSIKKFQIYKEIFELHRRYGDIVRVGPSELSVADPRAFNGIYGPGSQCTKGPWYLVTYPKVSMHTQRDRKEHDKRRRVWDMGFSAKALRDYRGRITAYTSQLLQNIDRMSNNGQSVDLSEWFNFYSFDIMGDLAFGKSFGMLKSGVAHYYLDITHASMRLVGAFGRLVWFFTVFKKIPGLNVEYVLFQNWVQQQVAERLKNEPEVPDVFRWLVEEYNKTSKPTFQQKVDLECDANLIVVAGSDTTAATLTFLFYQLALHPDVFRKLQVEVDEFFNDQSEGIKDENFLDHTSMSKLKYLQACIDESMRLWPAVLSGLQRVTPPGGIHFGDVFIPGNTIVQIPSWTIHRDPRCFKLPEEFIPERWTTKPDLTPNASVYAPFSIGRTSCIGRPLALMEIREVVVRMLHRYNIKLAASQKPDDFLDGIRDGFTTETPKLEIDFSLREKSDAS